MQISRIVEPIIYNNSESIEVMYGSYIRFGKFETHQCHAAESLSDDADAVVSKASSPLYALPSNCALPASEFEAGLQPSQQPRKPAKVLRVTFCLSFISASSRTSMVGDTYVPLSDPPVA
jgi:hypothetical protein